MIRQKISLLELDEFRKSLTPTVQPLMKYVIAASKYKNFLTAQVVRENKIINMFDGGVLDK